jgi:cysteine desulfurase / selenocysteine lyase
MKSQFDVFKIYKNLVYFDSAATTQKPKTVLDALLNGYVKYSFPAGRSVYRYAEETYEVVNDAKKVTSELLFGGLSEKNIFFAPSATVASNAIIHGLISAIKSDDSIAIQLDSHNSVIAPLIELQKRLKFNLHFFSYSNLEQLSKIKNLQCVFVSAVSNVTGHEINFNNLKSALNKDIFLFIDAAQLFSLRPFDSKKYSVDAIWGSSHKMYGPYGVSPVYISDRLSDKLNPIVVGGGNIEDVCANDVCLKGFPGNFSFGSINVPELYAYIVACKWVNENVYDKDRSEHLILSDLISKLKKFGYIIVSDKSSEKIATFYHPKISSHDIADKLSCDEICVRSGYFCSHLFFKKNNIPSCVRVSFGCYNLEHEIGPLVVCCKVFSCCAS